MTDPETKKKASRRRQRNFIAKELLSEVRYKKKIHLDEKANEKRKKYVYEEENEDSGIS